MGEERRYTDADVRADRAFLVGAAFGRSVALTEAADALEGQLGIRGAPRSLWEFRQWLRQRATAIKGPLPDPRPLEDA